MYQAIHLILQPQNVNLAVDTAIAHGARTATLMKARGCGHRVREKLLNIPLDQQMAFVLIIVETHLTDQIIRAVDKAVNFSQAGQGLLFTSPLHSYRIEKADN